MAYTVKIRTLPGSPMMAEYECYAHGVFEQLIERDEHGDPPATVRCPAPASAQFPPDSRDTPGGAPCGVCYRKSDLAISAPKVKFWSRDPVPIGRASKSDEKDPRMLDTEPLATGKMTRAEWNKYQRGITRERRHQKRLRSGQHQKRIQVDSKGVG
jgi:hypothetical protein